MTTAKAMICLLISVSILGANSPTLSSDGERAGAAVIIHRADIIPTQSTNSSARGGLWPLYSSPEARLNYFSVISRTPMHFHPDADHRLYVLEGRIVITCGAVTTTNSSGDFIVIPRGVRHSYDVPAVGERALLLTFDAPPYDPKKTVTLTPQKADSP